MLKISTIFAIIILSVTQISIASDTEKELFVMITTSDAETQMMALVLATQSANQDVPVRILLCGEAGNLAVKEFASPAFEPSGRSPKQLLSGLIERGIKTEVCGIFLPNRDITGTDLTEGIGIASPPEVAAYMKQDHIRYFTF